MGEGRVASALVVVPMYATLGVSYLFRWHLFLKLVGTFKFQDARHGCRLSSTYRLFKPNVAGSNLAGYAHDFNDLAEILGHIFWPRRKIVASIKYIFANLCRLISIVSLTEIVEFLLCRRLSR